MKKVPVIGIAALVLSLALCLGAALVFHPCAPKADGSWMNCHWAGNVVVALGTALSVLAAVRLFLPTPIAAGVSLSCTVLAAVAALVPGALVRLCMMADMRCHAVFRPSVCVLAALVALLSALDAALALNRAKAGR